MLRINRYRHLIPKRIALSRTTNRRYSTPTEEIKTHPENAKYKQGDVIHGWKLNKVNYVQEFNVTTYLCEHEKTGAGFFHVDAPKDQNNSFSISFQTPPDDSTGAPHILEHTTLCGSEKYPVRDLFFNMYKRSLNTYMNAYTAQDHTTYPFSTQNEKDYYNLMSVYLDATLFPRLLEMDFKQEGHRLEFDNPTDSTSELKIKGVVYNEMKGAMGDPNQFFSQALQQRIFPGTVYAHNSGGNPEDIPNITFEKLKAFHKNHYHPSQAKIYTYGDLPFDKHLKFLSENAFDKFERITTKNLLSEKVKRYDSNKTFYVKGPPDPMYADASKNIKMAVSYLCNDHSDKFESFAMSFLCGLLLDEPRGLFYKNLIESGIAPDFVPGTGYDSHQCETSFTVGVQGVSQDDIELLQSTIDKTFQQVIEEGIDKSLIESSLHNIELSIKTKSPNFGVDICYSIISNWLYYGDPVETLLINSRIERLRKEMEDPTFFATKIQKYFQNNHHKVTLVMSPDENHMSQQKKSEAARISAIMQSLTQGQKDELVEQYHSIEKIKSSQEENKTLLPTLTMSDIPRDLPNPIILEKNNFIELDHDQTNGIVYVTVLTPFELDDIPVDLEQYMSMFASVLSKLGAADMDQYKLAEQIELYTGGIQCSIVLVPAIKDGKNFGLAFKMTSHCLEKNTERMVDLMTAIYTKPRLTHNSKFLKNLIDQAAMEATNSIMHGGHVFAKLRSAASLSLGDYLADTFDGLKGVNYMNNLSSNGNIEEIAEQLQRLSNYLLRRDDMRVLITCESQHSKRIEKLIEIFHRNVEINKLTLSYPEIKTFSPTATKTYVKLPSSVSFTGQSVLTVPLLHKDSPVLRVASQVISSCYLHQEIREKGGAYGSSASQSMNGVFSFSSYRDPNPLRSLKIFENVVDWVSLKKFTNKELEEAKLQVFQQLDSPNSPHVKVFTQFIYNISDDIRQRRRNAVLDTTASDVIDVCNKYLSKDVELRGSAILGDESNVQDDIRNGKEWIYE